MIRIAKSRILVLLTPLFTVASAAVAGWLLKSPLGHWLGLLPVNQGTILVAMIAGAGAAIGAAIVFLHHNAWWEKYAAKVIDITDDTAVKAPPTPKGPPR